MRKSIANIVEKQTACQVSLPKSFASRDDHREVLNRVLLLDEKVTYIQGLLKCDGPTIHNNDNGGG